MLYFMSWNFYHFLLLDEYFKSNLYHLEISLFINFYFLNDLVYLRFIYLCLLLKTHLTYLILVKDVHWKFFTTTIIYYLHRLWFFIFTIENKINAFSFYFWSFRFKAIFPNVFENSILSSPNEFLLISRASSYLLNLKFKIK
jgi:hypothetical protein